jgi:Bacterial toxin 33
VERQWQQDKLLSSTEIARLKLAEIDIHELKGGRNASKRDLYKDGEGEIYIKPKGGEGFGGEPTGLNINDF